MIFNKYKLASFDAKGDLAMKKIAILPITLSLLLLVTGGASAQFNGIIEPDPELEINNVLTIEQSVDAYVNSGRNRQNDRALLYNNSYSGFDLGNGDRWMSTGDAIVLMELTNNANLNYVIPPATNNLMNMIGVWQQLTARANTGRNAQNSMSEVEEAYNVGLSAGNGARTLETGEAYVGIGSINNVNISHQ
jgi:hypothetical protein